MTILRGKHLLWMGVLVWGVVSAIRQAWISDDIYVTFRYCDNLLEGLGPVFNAGERVEGYTHFLWFVLLTLLRQVGISAFLLGKYAALPFYVATLVLLVRISVRLFGPRHSVLWPIAAMAWALHGEAQIFASSGLETSAFTFSVLLGYYFLCVSSHKRATALGAWAFAVSALLRPDGLLYLLLAGCFLALRRGLWSRSTLQFLGLALLLVAPQVVFRWLYYGQLFPNTYYAKSASQAHWLQGSWYLFAYFSAYFALLLSLAEAGQRLADLLRNKAQNTNRVRRHEALLLAFGLAAAHLLATARIGGDFMFGRLLLPATPLLLLLCEAALRRLRQPAIAMGATVLFLLAVVAGDFLKDRRLSNHRTYRGIVDERIFYPDWKLRDNLVQAEAIRPCIQGTSASALVAAGQLSLAYYADLPVAVEVYGLTDAHIAHSAIEKRGRPGHEKHASSAYIYERGVNFLFRSFQVPRGIPSFRTMVIETSKTPLYAEIIVYERDLMERLRSECPSFRFVDFPRWLQDVYFRRIPSEGSRRLITDYNEFRWYYFDHNDDPENLHERLVQLLAGRGITAIPRLEPPPGRFWQSTHLDDVGTARP